MIRIFKKATGGGGAAPTGTGFRHVTGGVEDGAAKLVTDADVASGAGILESKLGLNYPTHSNTNAVQGPASSIDLNLPVFDGTSGKLLKDSGENLVSLSRRRLISAMIAQYTL